LVSRTPPGLPGLIDGVLSAKRMGLPVVGAFVLGELLTELVEFGLEFGDAVVAFAAASAGRTTRGHEDHLDSGFGKYRSGKVRSCSIRGAPTS
jgi:hypothetical protein